MASSTRQRRSPAHGTGGSRGVTGACGSDDPRRTGRSRCSARISPCQGAHQAAPACRRYRSGSPAIQAAGRAARQDPRRHLRAPGGLMSAIGTTSQVFREVELDVHMPVRCYRRHRFGCGPTTEGLRRIILIVWGLRRMAVFDTLDHRRELPPVVHLLFPALSNVPPVDRPGGEVAENHPDFHHPPIRRAINWYRR